ncbi:hypothetical protein EEL39_12790 [Muribaculaceae bacterium Isolate-080 (Janvier)]|nr:hypothetical protein EEL39_12790 [Muribaculaceae bacterium Isolate-080 (Janvier)]
MLQQEKYEIRIPSYRGGVSITTGKGSPCSYQPCKVRPFGFRGKIFRAPRGLRYFSRKPCAAGTRPFKPVVMGTPAP